MYPMMHCEKNWTNESLNVGYFVPLPFGVHAKSQTETCYVVETAHSGHFEGRGGPSQPITCVATADPAKLEPGRAEYTSLPAEQMITQLKTKEGQL